MKNFKFQKIDKKLRNRIQMGHCVVYIHCFKLLAVEYLARFHLSGNKVGVVEHITKILHPFSQLIVFIKMYQNLEKLKFWSDMRIETWLV